MTSGYENGVPKVHPATREVLPEDPMNLHGTEVPGDPALMLRLLVEEYARMGWDLESLIELARDPNYQGFHGLLARFGEEELRRQIGEILARTGVMRTNMKETTPVSEVDLVEIDLLETSPRSARHA